MPSLVPSQCEWGLGTRPCKLVYIGLCAQTINKGAHKCSFSISGIQIILTHAQDPGNKGNNDTAEVYQYKLVHLNYGDSQIDITIPSTSEQVHERVSNQNGRVHYSIGSG